MQLTRQALRKLGTYLSEQGFVIGAFESIGKKKGGDIRLIQDIFQLMSAVSGIDVDENRAHLGDGKLQDHPLGPIRGPDADVLAPLDADGHQSASTFLNLVVKFSIGTPVRQPRKNQSIVVRKALGRP